MRFVFLAFLASHLLLAIAPARADIVYEGGDLALRVTQAPCPAEIAARARPGAREHYSLVLAHVKGRAMRACATLVGLRNQPGKDFVHLLYEDGGEGLIDYANFRSAPTT